MKHSRLNYLVLAATAVLLIGCNQNNPAPGTEAPGAVPVPVPGAPGAQGPPGPAVAVPGAPGPEGPQGAPAPAPAP
jgi:hypothetical protein